MANKKPKSTGKQESQSEQMNKSIDDMSRQRIYNALKKIGYDPYYNFEKDINIDDFLIDVEGTSVRLIGPSLPLLDIKSPWYGEMRRHIIKTGYSFGPSIIMSEPSAYGTVSLSTIYITRLPEENDLKKQPSSSRR